MVLNAGRPGSSEAVVHQWSPLLTHTGTYRNPLAVPELFD